MSGGGSKAPIPGTVRKMIQDIKEIAGGHTDEEIHAMLKECSMDPNETADKLLLQDPFHEVKRKRDRRKENPHPKESAESRRRPGPQGRGGRSGRMNFAPRHMSHDAGGGRNSVPGKENGMNQAEEKAVIPSLPASLDTKTKDKSPVTSPVPVFANGPASGPEESSSSVAISSLGTVPAPAYGNKDSVITYGTGDLNALSSPGSSNCSVSTSQSSSSAVCFSSLDPVLVPSSDLRPPSSVGAIKREVGNNRSPGEPNAVTNAENKLAAGSEISSGSMHGKMLSKPEGIVKNQAAESSLASSTLTHSSPSVTRPSSNYSSRSQQIIGPQKVGSNKEWKPKPTTSSVVQGSGTADSACPSDVPTVSVESTDQMQTESRVLDMEEATAKLQKKLQDLRFPQRQLVILPNHIHVPESERTKLSFGSFGASFGVTTSYVGGPESEKSSTSLSEASQDVEESVEEHASSHNTLVPSEEGHYPDHHQSPTHVPQNLPSGDGDVSSSTVPEYNESKQKTALASGGNQYSVVHTSPNYSFGLVPPMLGSQLAPFENSESQARDVSRLPSIIGGLLSTAGPTPLVTQAAGLMQSSIPGTQQPVPVFRPPAGVHISHYPPNFFPYGHYFSPFYVPPPAIPQYLANSGFPQQPPAGSVYPAPPGTPATGVKFSLPQYKQGTNTGNATHIGMPSGYGPYGSSPAGYNPSTATNAGNSTANEDLTGSQFKESSVYIGGQQSEGSAVWVATPGRDMSTLPSSFYNIPPQGQHVTFTPTQAGHGTFPGVYHPGQAVTAAMIHPLLQQSQTMAGAVDMVGPGGSVYQQPQQAQVNWPSNY